ncbi:MAG: hypothetical protein EOP19_12025 [Hyphomicrobiales bacterium]|nr:MAG: hypothetical protein EOP19_12025 [Hyphomicrobiales bacterium]
MNTIIKSALALACVAVLSACSSMITGGDLIRAGEATGSIEVYNNTNNVIDVVLISDCNASTYGLDRLGDNEVIAVGTSRAFTVSAGCWDVDAGTFAVGEARQRMNVAPGGITRYTVNS